MTEGLDVIVKFIAAAILVVGIIIGATCAGVAMMAGCNAPPPAACISLEDFCGQHYCTVEDFNDGRLKVNGLIPPQFDVMLCAGDVVEVAMKYPLTMPDGSKRYVTNRWIVEEPEKERGF